MPFKKGDAQTAQWGKMGGAANIANREKMKQAFIDGICGNFDGYNEKLRLLRDGVEISEPEQEFLDRMEKNTEFAIPKLARKEIDLNSNGPITINIMQFNTAPLTQIQNEFSGSDWDQLTVVASPTVSGRSV